MQVVQVVQVFSDMPKLWRLTRKNLGAPMWTELSDTAILSKLGTRLKAYRITRGMKQQELASESGVGISTIAKIESGQSVSFSLLISVMRTLGLLENLDLLIPEQKPSPLELLKMQGKQIKRVRTKKE